MKKIIAMILSVMMLLGCAAATAEDAGKTTLGTISINGAFTLQCGLPEGYKVTPVTADQDQVIAMLSSEDETKPVMMLSVAYDETYSDVQRMNDLNEEALALLEKTFTDVDPTVEITYGETGLGTQLLIAKQTQETFQYIDFMSIYKGYFVEFVLMAPEGAEDKALTEDQMRMAIEFLTELDFVPAEEGSAFNPAGKQFTARIKGYNEVENALVATLRVPVEMSAAEAEALAVGDTLALGAEETAVIETIEKDEFGGYLVNGEIELRKQEDGSFRVLQYEAEYMNDAAEVKIPVTEQVVFLDGIDPETGDVLEEAATKTAADLLAAMQAGDAVGFKSDNVKVVFDGDGNVVTIERFYTPWQ